MNAPEGTTAELRTCRGFAELDACVELQAETWGYSDRELMPRKGFLLAQELGGQVIGAFDGEGRLVAFAMAMAAFEPASRDAGPPQLFLHSHMLAVRPEWRNAGLGRRLKLFQREDALQRGIERMTWTFDPLRARNAHFNLHSLGAIARRYSPDFYGVSSSRLQGGLPSDRLHAEWWLRSERVATRAAALGAIPESQICGAEAPGTDETIPLPREAEQWRDADEGRTRLLHLQLSNRAYFQAAFARGLAAVDFTQDSEGHGRYHLAPWHPSLNKYPEKIE